MMEIIGCIRSLVKSGAEVRPCECGNHLIAEPPDGGWPDDLIEELIQ